MPDDSPEHDGEYEGSPDYHAVDAGKKDQCLSKDENKSTQYRQETFENWTHCITFL